MTPPRSDDSSRDASATSRRGALQLLAGASLGAIFASVARHDASAATCRPLGARCERNRQCCSRECHRDVCRRDREKD